METMDDLLAMLVRWFESWEQSTSTARLERRTERDYYDGKQWTAEEISKLKKRKQPVTTYNRIKPKINSLIGLQEGRRVEPRAYPRNVPNDDQASDAATKAMRFVMDQNSWATVESACFKNHCIEGMCGVDVGIEEKYPGELCITVVHMMWDRLWGDEHSRAENWKDAKYTGQVIWKDLDEAVQLWPDSRSALESVGSTWGTSDQYDDVPRTRWTDPSRKRVRVVDCYFQLGGTWFYAVFTRTAVLNVYESPYLDEYGVPCNGYEFSSCFVDAEGVRYGMVKDWISPQDEVNKRRSKAMHLLNSQRVKMELGAVENVAKLKQQMADPEGVIEIRPGMELEVMDNKEIADAHIQMMQEAKNEIDAVGVNAALAGTERRVMSGRALEQRSQQGLNEVGPVFGTFRDFKIRVYRQVWNRIKQFWKQEKWISVTDDDRNVEFVGFNVPLTLGEQLLGQLKQQPDVTPEMLAQAEEQAKNDPNMQVVVGLKNDVGRMDVDIRIDHSEASASLQGEQFGMLAEIAPNAGNMPPVLFEALVEASDLRNKDKILSRLRGEKENGPSPQEQKLAQENQELKRRVEENDLEKARMELENERKLFKLEQALAAEKIKNQWEQVQEAQRALAPSVANAVQ